MRRGCGGVRGGYGGGAASSWIHLNQTLTRPHAEAIKCFLAAAFHFCSSAREKVRATHAKMRKK